MPKVILICGKLCCGKSTYAERLRLEQRALLLSVDEIMLAVFGPYAGEKHNEYTEKIQAYLLEKSVEIIRTGCSVILDWGFWTKAKRTAAKTFFQNRGIACELHYIAVSDPVWQARIAQRNRQVLDGQTDAYFVDERLMEKFQNLFEPPAEDEIDVRVG